MNTPKIKVLKLEKNLIKAIKIINKFFEINNLNIKYTLTLDYSLSDSYGIFFPEEKNNITINPAQFQNTELEDPHNLYYLNDLSIQAVTIHEVCHMIDEKFKITDKYKEKFKDKLILNDNSNKNRYEEVVEIFRIFIMNPYLLKLISKDRFEFFKDQFKTPTPITKQNFLVKYKKWPKEIRELCSKEWGVKVGKGQKIEILEV